MGGKEQSVERGRRRSEDQKKEKKKKANLLTGGDL